MNLKIDTDGDQEQTRLPLHSGRVSTRQSVKNATFKYQPPASTVAKMSKLDTFEDRFGNMLNDEMPKPKMTKKKTFKNTA